jgi:AcrR family transcriptional regulator
MPRKPDQRLEGRILKAAYELWSKRGAKALTMRAVARAAETTTPTVYQRFRDKKDILELLRRQVQMNVYAAVEPARSLEEFCRRHLHFVLNHPNEYELLHVDWAARLERKEPRPSFELLKRRLAERLGGTPNQHARLALSLAALVHGFATQLLMKGVPESVSRELVSACMEAYESLIEHAIAKAGRRRRIKSTART